MQYIVTVSINVPYVPASKRVDGKIPKEAGVCPLNNNSYCTDIHARHHSTIVEAHSIFDIENMFPDMYIVRIEQLA